MYRKAILLALVSLGFATTALVVVDTSVGSEARALIAAVAAAVGAVIAVRLQQEKGKN